MNNKKISVRGFTLIEILVVVAIIGVLSSLILVGLNTARKQGRDARRIADLRQVQTGLELYFQKNGKYPTSMTSWSALQTELTTSENAPGGVTKIPNDPLVTQNYYYGSTDGSGYALGSKLEDSGNASLRDDVDGTVQGVSCDDPVYCIQF